MCRRSRAEVVLGGGGGGVCESSAKKNVEKKVWKSVRVGVFVLAGRLGCR